MVDLLFGFEVYRVVLVNFQIYQGTPVDFKIVEKHVTIFEYLDPPHSHRSLITVAVRFSTRLGTEKNNNCKIP